MVAWKEPHPKFKSSSKIENKLSTKPKSFMELKETKEPKILGFSTLAENIPKPSQSKPNSHTSKCVKAIIEEFTKNKTPSLMDKNSKSFKNGEE